MGHTWSRSNEVPSGRALADGLVNGGDCQRDELITASARLRIQPSHLLLLPLFFEQPGPAIHPSLALGEQPVNQDPEVAGHGFYRQPLRIWRCAADADNGPPDRYRCSADWWLPSAAPRPPGFHLPFGPFHRLATGNIMRPGQTQPGGEVILIREGAQIRAELAQDGQCRNTAEAIDRGQIHAADALQFTFQIRAGRLPAALACLARVFGAHRRGADAGGGSSVRLGNAAR